MDGLPGAQYRLLDGETKILPGVRLLPTPGHTPGHQSLLVETAMGLAILAGQAVYAAAEFAAIRTTGQLSGLGPAADRAAAADRVFQPRRCNLARPGLASCAPAHSRGHGAREVPTRLERCQWPQCARRCLATH